MPLRKFLQNKLGFSATLLTSLALMLSIILTLETLC